MLNFATIKKIHTMIKVGIADDHAVIRKGLQLFINEDKNLSLVTEASDGEELMRVLKERPIDILLLDIDMPKMNGLAILRELETSYPKLKTIILSMHAEDIYGINARRMGARGYVSKDSDPNVIISAIKAVAEGKQVFREELYRFNRHGFVPAIKMSKRETQVLKLLVGGHSNKQISEELGISDKTVSTYKLRLMRKLNAKSVVDLVKYVQINAMG
jgi:DNA-binding NarL/FixJ family response regulator